MEDVLETLLLNSWDAPISDELKQQSIEALESGKVLYLPRLPFALSENESRFLDPKILDPKSKNISYDIRKDKLGGSSCQGEEAQQLKTMIKRYATSSRSFFEKLFPHYTAYLNQARTSFRPAEASGRNISLLKDDTRLHVDSFPANPVKGARILRFFTNVNPHGKPRVWRLGEPFKDVVEKMAHRVKKPFPGLSSLLKLLGITKDYRTLYDHYMLKIHDSMKMDDKYQETVCQHEVRFLPGSSWIVYTDQVSHAAMSGQHLFEQTFHLPVEAMLNPESPPQKVLEKHLGRKLV